MDNKIDRLFDILISKGGSDLHLVEGQAPKVRAHGRLAPLEGEPILTRASIRELMEEILDKKRWLMFLERHDMDFAYQKDAKYRFRSNFYFQIHGMAAVFRVIPTEIMTLEQLGLIPVIQSFAHLRSGLVLVTGPTGSGKSTTLAAVINHINENYHRSILTIEEPIEFVHPNKKSCFTQREVGLDVHTFADGLRTASRQDCDVILVGEMRDYETISVALTAAAMGVLVFGTLHTNSAIKTVNRIIDVFPTESQGMARTMLADTLRGIVAQLLLKTTDGKRVAANEVLVESEGLGACIREDNISGIQNIIQSGKLMGMQVMDQAISGYYSEGRFSGEEAYLKAEIKDDYEKYAPK